MTRNNTRAHNATRATRRRARWLAAALTLCAAGALTTQAEIIAHWNFDETAGKTAHDNAGPFDGTLSPTGAAFVSGGISGNAISLSKANDGFVNMGNVLGLTQGDFSVVAWVKLNAGDSTECSTILAKQEAGSATGYLLGINACVAYAQAGRAWFSDSDDPGQEVTSTTSVNDGNWHQIVGVYQAGRVKLIYVDGAPAEATNASRPIVANNGAFLIGGVDLRGTPGGQFTGWIDEVQIYDHALNDGDVDFLFHNPTKVVKDCATQLAECQAELAAARARIQELEAEKATIDAQLRWLTSNFQQMFNDPQFKIFGETTAQQIRTLAGGILNLNLAEKQALYLSLGGQPAPN